MEICLTRVSSVLFILCFFIQAMNISSCDGNSLSSKKAIFVNDDADSNWYDATHVKTICEGIKNASSGDMVYVFAGIYYENITIDKSLDLIGEHQENTSIDGYQTGDDIVILANNVTVSRFTLKNTSKDIWQHAAIKAKKGTNLPLTNINISWCIITNNKEGIIFDNVSDSLIMNCIIKNNSATSIDILHDSKNITITNCTIYQNGEEIGGGWIYNGGITIDGSPEKCKNVMVKKCLIYDNIGAGIDLTWVCNITMEQSYINNNSWFGVSIGSKAENITINSNFIFRNKWTGVQVLDGVEKRILLRSLSNISINNNILSQNGDGRGTFGSGGIYIQNCINSVIVKNNNITDNNEFGISLLRSRKNSIEYNNFINNTNHASFFSYSLWNKWYDNYWDDWKGVGPKIIRGTLKEKYIPWFNADWHPSHAPLKNNI